MKTIKGVLLSVFAFLFFISVYAQDQEVVEPDFVGECFYLKADGTNVKLDKSRTVSRTKANAGIFIAGVGKVRDEIHLETPAAKTRISGRNIKLIVKAVDNLSDPMTIIRIFKFETKKKYRKAVISEVGTFSGAKGNDLEYVDFEAKKYGQSSYYLSITNTLEPGEYGIIVTNPNNKDEKQIVVSCFGIDK